MGQRMKIQIVVICAFLALSTSAKADFIVIPIQASGLPYALSPSNYDNSPSNYDNSSSNYDNSSSNYDNSPSNYENSSSKYENGPAGRRRLLTSNGDYLGYFVFSKKGVLNLYSRSGRVAYMPSGGKTQSFFLSEGSGWCGTIGNANGQTVIGMTQSCLLQFMADQ